MPEAKNIGVMQQRPDGTMHPMKSVDVSYDQELPTPDVEIRYDDRQASQQTIEAEQELFEENYRAAHARRWKGQQRWMGRQNEEMRLVNILHPHAIIRKLREAGVDAAVEPAFIKVWVVDDKTGLLTLQEKTRSTARLWLHENAVYLKGTTESNAGRIGVSAWVWDDQLEKKVVKCLTSLQWDCGPEWSLMYFDALDVPVRERYRGWRTALLALIVNDVLTEDEVDRAFGPVIQNEASELYRETLQSYRERKAGR
jgi:hypothetical protein